MKDKIWNVKRLEKEIKDTRKENRKSWSISERRKDKKGEIRVNRKDEDKSKEMVRSNKGRHF